MPFQLFNDPVNVGLRFVIPSLQPSDPAAGSLKEPQEAALFLFRGKALQFGHKVRDHLTGLAQILCAHTLQYRIGEGGDLLLAGSTVLQNDRGIVQVNFLRKRIDLLLLLRRQGLLLQIMLRKLLRRRHRRNSFFRMQCEFSCAKL